MAHDAYIRRCSIERTIDGDTVIVYVDLGFNHYSRNSVRLLGIDAPELRGDTYDAAKAARDFTIGWCIEHRHGDMLSPWPFSMRSEKDDSFGRYLAYITCHQAHSLNQALLDSGNAVPRAR